MILIKTVSLLNIYFFLTGLFKNIKYKEERSEMIVGSHKKYSKLIYIVLDALRFDYTIDIQEGKSKYIHNKMKFLSSVDKFHALSIAGIPTSTTCRITGLLTGAPSNFLEGSKTFLSSRIRIDNLVEQVHKRMTTSFYGDKTWLHLFPLLEQGPSSTLDPYTKKDLLKEEERVMKDMLENLGKTEATFCHLITLDSFGHAFGTDHKMIEDTLLRFDKFVEEVYLKMDDETLLVITSDHGVTDEGAHGGVSQREMSSVVSFISKRGILQRELSEEILKMRRECLSQSYDFACSFFKTQVSFPVVHQDDILPTVCFLLHLPIPLYTYGNFIHELVDEREAYETFLKQKEAIVPNTNSTDGTNDLIGNHYRVSRVIYKSISGNNNLNLFISLFISLLLLLKYIRVIPSPRNIFLLVVCCYLSFSVNSVIHEDVIWISCFLIFNLTPIHLLASFLYLAIDKNYGVYDDPLAYFKESFILDHYGSLRILPLLFVFALVSKKKGIPTSFLKDNPLLLLSLCKYFFKSHFTPEFNLCLVSNNLSLGMLSVVVFRPLESIFLLSISKYLEYEKDMASLYILLNLSVGYSGMIKQIQCLNYEVAYTFSSNPDGFLAIIPVLVYFLYPRYLILRRFPRNILREYIFFDFLNLLLVCSFSYYFFDSMNFYFHFASRCFFVCFYFLVDVLLTFML